MTDTLPMRSDHCGTLRPADIGRRVALCGWVARRREHGEHLAFVDLRDHTGLVQCVVDGSADLRSEYVVRIVGTVRARLEGTQNANLATGEVELGECEVEILNAAEPPPFQLDDRVEVDEMVRLAHRYIDLRTERMQRNLRLRARVNRSLRQAMDDQGFVEIETPMLIASTPEGARDFVVPSRLSPGQFYALPQSPQLFKQLCMVGGVDRYYQIARCLRDEDLRADRQFEFMQLDAEASFTTQEEVLAFISVAVSAAVEAVTGEGVGDHPPHDVARGPGALRLGQARHPLRPGADRAHRGVRRRPEFNAFKAPCVKGIRVPGGGRHHAQPPRRPHRQGQAVGGQGPGLDAGEGRRRARLTGRQVPLRHGEGGAGRRPPRPRQATSSSSSPTSVRRCGTCSDWSASSSVARRSPRGASSSCGSSTSRCSRRSPRTASPIPAHHPFTMPHPEDVELLDADDPADLLRVRSQSYDLVLNGWELGSGSVRIHRSDIQSRMFGLLGISDEEARAKFGFLLDAFRFGAPPHAGFAFGIDRLVALLAGEENIREVIAFPKTQSGTDPLTHAPTPIDASHLDELGLRLLPPKAAD